ncbi:UdgX family uracil-DNA binding protein [Verticiella sediminum]|uniref:Type-4 uracil-DNA glycosylase n=1 Tax=Verticiella sediminum TaxID=1247510 RepID=A0A556ANR9_9BURK|nr:UdgX family uracil-DNA binding protein [Verticiella sediminum]
MRAVVADDSDFDGFRRRARALLLAGVAPADVVWQVGAGADLFCDAAQEDIAGTADPGLRVSREFLRVLALAALHSEPGRHALLYRLLWRVRAEPALARDTLDADHGRVRLLARAVQRDMHKMKAFVRFRPMPAQAAAEVAWRGAHPPSGDAPLHVAWFEPEHHIVEAVGPFFARRFAGMPWAVLTPRRSLRWDGASLAPGPGAARASAPAADADESLWLTYYRSVFNPARLKLRTMENEMPRRYWRNLPEAALIAPLANQAAARTGQMLAAQATGEAAHALALRRRAKLVPISPAAAHDLDGLAAQVAQCRACPLGEHATQAVFGCGRRDAHVMVVGEQPGDQEDLRGLPFVGPAGQLLDRAFGELGWNREQLYLTNAVKHFKFELRGKRRMHKTPGQREALACAPWLEGEIRTVKPRAIIALGATAARSLLAGPVAVTAQRGQWLRRSDTVPVLVTLHPAALLRSQSGDDEGEYRRWVADLARAAAYVG